MNIWKKSKEYGSYLEAKVCDVCEKKIRTDSLPAGWYEKEVNGTTRTICSDCLPDVYDSTATALNEISLVVERLARDIEEIKIFISQV
jgi:hypothetical protein